MPDVQPIVRYIVTGGVTCWKMFDQFSISDGLLQK